MQLPLQKEEQKYMQIHREYPTDELGKVYGIDSLFASDWYVYCEIQKSCVTLNKSLFCHIIN